MSRGGYNHNKNCIGSGRDWVGRAFLILIPMLSRDRGAVEIPIPIFIEIGEYCPNLSRPWLRSIRTRTWPVRDRAQATLGRLRHWGPWRRSSRSSLSIYFISRAQSMAICRILIEPWSIRTSFLLTKIGPSSGTSSSSGPSPTTPLSSTVTSRLS